MPFRPPMSFLHIISLSNNEGELSESELLEELSNVIRDFPDATLEVHHVTGMTPVHYAARERSAAFIQLLCADNTELARRTNNEGELPFHIACRSANIDAVEYLYHLYPDCIDHILTPTLERPLHILLKRGEHRNLHDVKDTCKFLVQQKPHDLDAADAEGNLPLHYAAEFQDVGCAVYVFNAHPLASLERNNNREYPAQCAKRWEGRGELGGRYWSKPNQHFFGCQLVRFWGCFRMENSIHRLLYFWRRPVAWNDRVTFGTIKLQIYLWPTKLHICDNSNGRPPWTPLLIACERCQDIVVEFIIRRDNSTLSYTCPDGNTALHVACLAANYDVVCLLLSHSAYGISHKNNDGMLPIELLVLSYQGGYGDDDYEPSSDEGDDDEDLIVDYEGDNDPDEDDSDSSEDSGGQRVVRRGLTHIRDYQFADAADSDDDDDGLRRYNSDDDINDTGYVSALYHLVRTWPDICSDVSI